MRAPSPPSPALTILCLHKDTESQVLAASQEPAVTGRCHVQHQPALVLSLKRLKIQKQQVRLPVDTKEQLTGGQGGCPIQCPGKDLGSHPFQF